MRGRARAGVAGGVVLKRREVLLGGAGLAAVAGSLGARQTGSAASDPRVVVVGSGIGGLGCAYVLWRRYGVRATVFEYDSRVGGRIQTLRGFFDEGQLVEQHGEFISSEHVAMRALAHSFGLRLDNTDSTVAGAKDSFRFDGADWSQAGIDAEWQAWGWELFRNAVRAAPWPTLHDRYTPTARLWDHMSVPEWLDAHVPGGSSSLFGRLCISDVLAEYGGPPEQQSALNLVYLLGLDSTAASGFQPRRQPLLAGTDEMWHIHGGNDQVITGIVDRLPAGAITVGEQLVAVRPRGSGGYACTFSSGQGVRQVNADHVVLALPFVKLREVDLTGLDIPAVQRRAIDEEPLGSNDKIEMQFSSRVWNADGRSGNLNTDGRVQEAWEATTYQPGRAGILIGFPGGHTGANLGTRYGLGADEGPAPAPMVADYLASLEPSFPGLSAAWNGRAYYQWSSGDIHIGGAYSYLAVGQYTGFNGVQGRAVGGLHFAGEHTSQDFQGYMEGALRSGFRCAREIAQGR
jgi:monoamine oxidase